MAAIPGFMPTVLREGYTGGFSRPFSRTQMEDTQYSVKRETTREQFLYSYSWKLTWLQLGLFEAWLEYDLKGGTEYFEIAFAGKIINAKPYTGMPSVTPSGDKWIVRMEVEELQASIFIPARTGALPVWPELLPSFESEGYAYAKDSAVAKSDVDFGLSDMRVRFKERVTRFSGKILVNLEQRNIFWDFYKVYLINGNSYFSAPFIGSQGESKIKSRFVEKPNETPNGAWFSISISLETTKAPILTKAQYQSLSNG